MDELIDDLERVVEPAPRPFDDGMPPLAELQYWTDRVLYDHPLRPEDLDGTAKPVKSDLDDAPEFQAFLARYPRFFKRREAPESS